ncbi:MAG: hypothetical protein V1806_05685 [Pseudomonadota bacterium]
MRRNLDICLGILAWLFGIGCIFASDIFPQGMIVDAEILYMPTAWLVCIIALLIIRKRPLGDYWWVWYSIVPAMYKLAIFGWVLYISAKELIFKS